MASKPDSSSAYAAAPPTYEQATGMAGAGPQMPPMAHSQHQTAPPPMGFHPIVHPPTATNYYPGQEPPPVQVIHSEYHTLSNRSWGFFYSVLIHFCTFFFSGTILVQPAVGPYPTPTTCPHCLKSIRTEVRYDPNARTHLFALILCLLWVFIYLRRYIFVSHEELIRFFDVSFSCFPCCLLPYCIAGCNDTNHYCPSCGHFVGTYNLDRF